MTVSRDDRVSAALLEEICARVEGYFMRLEDEAKGIARFLFGWLGFPLGPIAVLGVFSVGMAIFQGEISFGSKRLVFGALLISFCGFASHLPMIIRRGVYHEGERRRWLFGLSGLRPLIWTVVFGAATYLLARILYPTM
jgi:hypothetical protein